MAISSVVLSGQRVEMRDALYDAMKGKDAAKQVAADPLVQNGAKLIPSVTRVFSRERQLYVYLQAYEPTGAAANTLVGFVSFYKDGVKVLETQPVAVNAPAVAKGLGVVPMNFSVALGKLEPGQYDCQVSVLDPAGNRGTFWSAPIAVSP